MFHLYFIRGFVLAVALSLSLAVGAEPLIERRIPPRGIALPPAKLSELRQRLDALAPELAAIKGHPLAAA